MQFILFVNLLYVEPYYMQGDTDLHRKGEFIKKNS